MPKSTVKIASISEIKNELSVLPQKELAALCLRLAKHKKDNKELLTFLLFESTDIEHYINSIKQEMEEQFEQVNRTNTYFALKSIRKILRITNKFIRYTASKEADIELRIYFCHLLKTSGIKILKSTALTNLYYSQLKKIDAAISLLHEDLQHDYAKQIEALELK